MNSTAARAGAIALTMIIVVPILLAYTIPSGQTTTEYWESDQTVTLDTQIGNSTAPYYGWYYDSASLNGMLVAKTSLQATEYRYWSPAYYKNVEYSSLPIYTSTTSSARASNTVPSSVTTSNWGPYTTYTDAQAFRNTPTYYEITGGSGRVGFVLDYDTSPNTVTMPYSQFWTWKDDNARYVLYAQTDGDNAALLTLDKAHTFTVFGDYMAASWRGTLDVRTYTSSNEGTLPTNSTYTFSAPYRTILYVDGGTTGDGIVITLNKGDFVTVANNTISFEDGTTYQSISQIRFIVLNNSVPNITYTITNTSVKGYADPSYGWWLPSNISSPVYFFWDNSQSNSKVLFYVTLQSGEWATLAPRASLVGTTSENITITRDTDGIAYAYGGTTAASDKVALGNYGAFAILINAYDGNYRIDCLGSGGELTGEDGQLAWPTYGSTATAINSVTIPMVSSFFEFRYVAISAPQNGPDFRVDAAYICSGYYSATEDYAFSPTSIWPDTSLQYEITSIGIYGTNLTIAGLSMDENHNFVFTDLDGEERTVAANGVIVIWDKDDPDVISLNGYKTAGDGTASAKFDGLWVLHVSGSKLEKIETTSWAWIPGGFAFDSDQFKVAMLLCAVLAFVGLALWGTRSGSKALFLLVVCGGAIFVIMLLL